MTTHLLENPGVARKRKTRQDGSTSKPKPIRQGEPLYVYLDSQLRAALLTSAERNRRTLTAEVSIALEEYLTKHNLWPPPADAS